jgi:hypothetical protein
VRAQGRDGEDADAEDPAFPSGRGLASLALHEFGHSFVNSALERGAKDPRLAAIYRPVASEMRTIAYGMVPIFLNELVLQAVCLLAERDLGYATELDYEIGLRSERQLGFYPARRVAELLEEYRADRTRYPDFAGFVVDIGSRAPCGKGGRSRLGYRARG